MRVSLSQVYAGLLGLAIVLPLFSFVRYAPLADWYFTGLAFLLVAACVGVNLLRRSGLVLPIINIFILLFVVVIQFTSSGLAVIPVLLLLLLFFLFSGLYVNIVADDRRSMIQMLAQIVFVGALVQAALGFSQVIGLVKIFNGWVIYDVNNPTGNIFGNTGQRNHFADFLGWGVAAGSYLYAVRKMRLWVFVLSAFLLVLLIAWCGSRMPLGYALVLCGLAWFWLRRMAHDPEVIRMAGALAFAVILLAFVQIFGHQLNIMLNEMGLPVHLQSGSDRILDANMGARRRVEWTKAFEMFLSHPVLGVGLGNFAHYSVSMEAHAGLPKFPESWLFTNCHNLIFQLLAETGLVGCIIVLGGLACCLLPYLYRGNQSADNLLLLSIASVIIGHSMLEYPLWYWPFLSMLLLICALSPLPSRVLKINPLLSSFFSVLVIFACIANFYFGYKVFWDLVGFNNPSPDVQEDIRRVGRLQDIARNPLWRPEAELVLSNYLLPTRSQLSYKIKTIENMAKTMPYSQLLFKLAILYSMNMQADKAREAMVLGIANYPDLIPAFSDELSKMSDPALGEIKEMAARAKQVYGDPTKITDERRIATVMTVASPVTRKPLF